jgi:hypothetical protein
LFTITVEVLILFLFLRFVLKEFTVSWERVLLIGTLASATTLPYVSFVFPKLFDWSRSTSLPVSELFAVIVEMILYKLFLKLNWKTSFIISLVCNIISYYLGSFLHSNGYWFVW